MDHRGDVKGPGVVVNLVDEESEEIKLWEDWFDSASTLSSSSLPPSSLSSSSASTTVTSPEGCFGCVYYIPPEICDEVIKDLDFREKGGYVRTQGKVELLDYLGDDGYDGDDSETKVVDAVLYRGVIPRPPG